MFKKVFFLCVCVFFNEAVSNLQEAEHPVPDGASHLRGLR